MRVEEAIRSGGPAGLKWLLAQDDQIEGILRHLAAAREFKLHGDTHAARSILTLRRPGA